jgi:hypothetical protein
MEGLTHTPRHQVIHKAALLSASALICFGIIIFVVEIAQGVRPLLGSVCLFLYWLNYFGLTRTKQWLNLLALLSAGFCILFALLLIAAFVHQSPEMSCDTFWIILLYALLHSFCFYELLHRYREIRRHLQNK